MSILAKGRSTRTPETAELLAPHAGYLRARGVDAETAAGAFRSARLPSEIPAAFSSWQRRHRAPAIVAELVSPDGETPALQIHPDRPGKDKKGKPRKWESPAGRGSVLGVYPGMLPAVRSSDLPLWVVEGATRAAVLARAGMPAVAIPGVWNWQKGGDPLACWEHVALDGRTALVGFDADYRTNANVQLALSRLVAFLESRGARVLVARVPEVGGDEHAGLDDYAAAGGDLEALARDAAPFAPADVARERLTRDEKLRRAVADLAGRADALESRRARECSALAVARFMAETAAPAHGRPVEGGVKVRPSARQIALGLRVGLGTVSRALEHLEHEAGFLRVLEPAAGGRATSYLLICDPWGGGSEFAEHIEGGHASGGEGREQDGRDGRTQTPLYQRDSSSSVPQTRALIPPPLRNSKVVHTYERRGGERVVVHSDFYRRYGKKREAIFRRVLEAPGVVRGELLEKFGSKKARWRDFRRTWLRPMLADGVLVEDGPGFWPSPDWPAALERVKARTDEDGDTERQRERYAEQGRTRRERLEAEKRGTVAAPEPTPELAGPERVAEIFAGEPERDHAARVEEQRRKAGTTAETFISDTLEGLAGFGWRELGDLWAQRGGRRGDLRRIVQDPASPYRLRRGGDDSLYVERAAPGAPLLGRPKPAESLRKPKAREGPDLTKPETGPRRDALRNTPRPGRETMRNDETAAAPRTLPPKRDGVIVHGPACSCWICEDEPVEMGASA